MQKITNIALICGVFILLILGYLHPVTAFTQDLGRHLLTGQIILTTHAVPKVNLFSYTYPAYPFINHHWFSEVLLFLQGKAFGSIGIQLISITVVTAAFGLVFFFAKKHASLPILAFLSILYLRILFERTDIRPEIYSFLFLSLFVTILYAYREKFTKLLYLLIPVELLWVNMHIYFFVGIVILCLFLLDEVITHRKNLRTKHTLTLAGVTLGAILVAFINPNGIQGILYPLHVFQNYGYTIEENQTIFLLEQLGFQKASLPYFKISVLLLFLSLAISYKKTRPIDWLLSAAFAYAGVMAIRNLPLFVFATLIPASMSLTWTIEKLSGEARSRFARQKKHVPKYLSPTLLLSLFVFLLWQIVSVVNAGPIGLGVAKGASKAADFYIENNLSGPVFNNFDIGSYLEYRLYPKGRVFIDGRPEAYPAEFIQGVYIPMQQDKNIFAEAQKKYGFTSIFFSHADQTPWGTTFLKDVLRSPDWKPVYLDDTIIILVKDNPKNAKIIKKFGMNPEKMHITGNNPNDLDTTLRLTAFFNKTGLTEQELIMYQQLLLLKPDYCPALYNSTTLLSAKNDPSANIYAARYQQFCNK